MIELSQSNYKEGQKYFNYEINNINNKLSLVKNINKRLESVFNLYLDELDAASENVEIKIKKSSSSSFYKEFK